MPPPSEGRAVRLPRVIAAVAPRADAETWSAALAAPMRSAGITTPRRIAMFIGQLACESGGFRLLEEDLVYRASRLCQVWPAYFPTLADAIAYANNARGIANRVYANRLGNGDADSGDGWRYRGRGLVQLTGRGLYSALARVEPRAGDPDWLTTPAGAAISACWYWSERGELLALSDAWDIEGVTRRINGGETDLAARTAAVEAALAVLTPADADAEALDRKPTTENPA